MRHVGRPWLAGGVAVCAACGVVSWGSAGGLGPEEIVQAGGSAIAVPGYSVPSFVRWDGDGLRDLVIGEGGGGVAEGKVRIYLNGGTASEPEFFDYVYAQSLDTDLVCDAAGCMGVFPRVVYWDGDGRKDLLAGQAGGTILLFTNVGTDDAPRFDGGSPLQVGEPGAKADIDVGARATPAVVDFNGDGKKDLVVGALDGLVRIYLNEGADDAPDFRSVQFALEDGGDLVVSTGRSSPRVLDHDEDGRKDIVTGNTAGELAFYANIGTDEAPEFAACIYLNADGVPIDLPGSARSRPFDCDWAGDGAADFLVGGGDGLVRLYQGSVVVGVDPAGPWTPHEPILASHPNPVRVAQWFRVTLREQAEVRLRVFDARGRVVATILEATLDEGVHARTWEPVDRAGQRLPGGVYLVRLEAGAVTSTQKVVLTR